MLARDDLFGSFLGYAMSFLFSIIYQIITDILIPQKCLQIVQLHYENQRSVKSFSCPSRGIYSVHHGPYEPTIANSIHKLDT